MTRRKFLAGTGVLASGVILAACNAEKITETITQKETITTTTTQPAVTATVTAPPVTTTIMPSPTKLVSDQLLAKYMIIQDPLVCVGCGRCELVCTEYNLGKAKPQVANIKISRNANFGPGGSAFSGMERTHGKWGDARVIAETCKQCPHPVPCMQACPEGAIEVDREWNTRVVNQEKCIGCGLCTKACPWGMITVDTDTQKARKCDLCGGDPECVKICPTGALRLVSWLDRTGDTPGDFSIPAFVSSDYPDNCGVCHQIGKSKGGEK